MIFPILDREAALQQMSSSCSKRGPRRITVTEPIKTSALLSSRKAEVFHYFMDRSIRTKAIKRLASSSDKRRPSIVKLNFSSKSSSESSS